ncbi:MAG TPA: holo-ACP synthase [Actinomycetota bacterium]|nr:holo-ACP synthase [Actinomycetota bacterium]
MLGIDVVDIERLRGALARNARLKERLFTKEEIAYCEARRDPLPHFAARLAAKEAVMKALGLRSLPAWAGRIEIVNLPSGRPAGRAQLTEGVREVEVSISHDGPVAVAVARD